MKEILERYIHDFSNLNRSKAKGGAPHKPILLLSILRLYDRGDLQTNRIEISPELVLEFKDIWSKIVVTEHTCNFALPFFHMQSEPFWSLVSFIGKNIPITSSGSIKSMKGLRESVAYAEINKDLFELCMNPINRAVLIDSLLEQYFSSTKSNFTRADFGTSYELSNQILHEDKQSYELRIQELKKTLKPEDFEEEVFVRSGAFKREVPKIYGFQCAISEMKIESTSGAQMIDACHIEPFSVGGDDTVKNGISLCPNLHRAFDRGLITINEDFIVRVSPTISENSSPFSLRQFEGKQILLPNQIHYYPSIENLAYHRKEIFQM